MRSVVGGHGGDAPVGKCPAQGGAVGLRLNGGIALDARAEAGIILVGKQQVRHARLGRDKRIARLKQLQFALRGKMRYVQAAAVFLGEAHGKRRGFIASLGGTDFGVVAHVGVCAIGGLAGFEICLYRGRVFAVRHDGQPRVLEDGAERALIVYEHIAGRRAHKEFDAAHLARIEAFQFVGVAARCAVEETEIHEALMLCRFPLFVERLHRGGLRHGVGHIEHRGHAARSGGLALGEKIGLCRQTRVAEMHVRVYDAGQDVCALGVDYLVHGTGRLAVAPLYYFIYTLIVDDYRAHKTARLVDNRGVLNLYSEMHGLVYILFSRRVDEFTSKRVDEIKMSC